MSFLIRFDPIRYECISLITVSSHETFHTPNLSALALKDGKSRAYVERSKLVAEKSPE